MIQVGVGIDDCQWLHTQLLGCLCQSIRIIAGIDEQPCLSSSVLYQESILLKRTGNEAVNSNNQISWKNRSAKHWILSSYEWGNINHSAAEILLNNELPSWGVKQKPQIS